MLDIRFIEENPELVKEACRTKGVSADIDLLLSLATQRRTKQQEVESLRRQRNEVASSSKNARPSPEQIALGKKLKEDLTLREAELAKSDEEFDLLLKQVPNIPLPTVPVGLSEQENKVVQVVGTLPQFSFVPKQHHQIAEPRGLIDKERAAKIAGSRFAYVKGELVLLQFAIMQFVMATLSDESIIAKLISDRGLSLSSKPFTPILPPAVLRTAPYTASARLNAEEVTYKLADDDLWLNASAEHTLCTMYWNEILPEEDLPIRYIGYSTSFRREAGTYGKDVEGIFRLHQFDKLEMEVFSTKETGPEEHQLLIAVQEHLLSQLQIPYRVIQKCTFDIGKPNAAGVDMEAWLPGQNTYRETHTADYMTDYQARDLNTRVRRTSGEVEYVHTNDATAFALGRIMIAIIENNQREDGSISVPTVLRSFLGGRELI